MKGYEKIFKEEDDIIKICKAIDEGAPRGEMLDDFDFIEEVFFEAYNMIMAKRSQFARDVIRCASDK